MKDSEKLVHLEDFDTTLAGFAEKLPDHDILTLEEVADYLRVSERTVYDWANKGSIPCGKLGTSWRFKRSEIERWVNDKLGGQAPLAASHALRIADVLTPDRILLVDTDRKAEILTQLVDCLATTAQVKDRDELADAILAREELMSTGIGFGVAVPHVRLDSVSDLVMAVALCARGITDYVSLDSEPVRIVCMVAARYNQHAQYLKTLSAVSALLKQESVRKALLEVDDIDVAYLMLTR